MIEMVVDALLESFTYLEEQHLRPEPEYELLHLENLRRAPSRSMILQSFQEVEQAIWLAYSFRIRQPY